MIVKFKGNDVTLEGREIKVGDKAPEFVAVDNSLEDFTFKAGKGVKILLSVPSVDTRVCDLEVKEFNKRAAELGDVYINTISMDLPFAQSRWCAANDIEAVKTFSDYKYRSFGEEYGVFIKELALLTRAAFVVDSTNTVVYVEYCPEVSSAPDYEAIIKVAKEAK